MIISDKLTPYAVISEPHTIQKLSPYEFANEACSVLLKAYTLIDRLKLSLNPIVHNSLFSL